jgi:hypothetical protein
MPLIQGKSKSAFSHNVGAEMNAGKPQKQAVAIAYSEKAKAEHKKHLARGGKVAGCSYCMGGYAEGGTVPDDDSQKTLGEIIGYPKAEGGEVEDGMMDDPDHEAMLDQCADECMQAIEMKDKTAFRHAIEFLIMDVLSQNDEE